MATGNNYATWPYVDDVVDAALLAAIEPCADRRSRSGQRRAAHQPARSSPLLIDINAGGEYRSIPFPPDRKAIDIGDYYADFGKIRQALNWTPRVPLADGLRRSLDYYRHDLPHYL